MPRAIKNWLQSRLRYEQAERLRGALCAGVYYSGLGWLLVRGRRRGATVLIYHSVGGDDIFSDNVVPDEIFDAHMQLIRDSSEPVPLSRIVAALLDGRAPDPNWVAVTFDDGYRDFVTRALPILERHRVPVSLFVPTMILDGQELFFDEVERLLRGYAGREIVVALDTTTLRLPTDTARGRRDAALRLALALRQMDPSARESGLSALRSACGNWTQTAVDSLYLTAADLAGLPDWVEVGSHSVGHHCLAGLDDAQLAWELVESASRLGQVRGRAINSLAYPFGKPWSFDDRVRRFADAAGYSAALTTVPGQVFASTARFEIPRYAGGRSLSRLRLNLMGLPI
jgi:peptidoglycan/xylan/chitin deacetylase (PgdA/CDA1 family)